MEYLVPDSIDATGETDITEQLRAFFAVPDDNVRFRKPKYDDTAARGEVGMPSPSADEIAKFRDERNEALAELHEANRWLWLAREQGFVPNSGAGSPSPEQITDEMVENGARWWWDHGMISPRSSISFDDSSHEEIKDGARSFARKFLVAACSVRGET